MKKFYMMLLVVGFVSGCRNTHFSDQENTLTQSDIDQADSGLQLTVKNSLPAEKGRDEQKVYSHLNAFVCVPHKRSQFENKTGDENQENGKDKETYLKHEERCIRLKGAIKNGETETFLVPKGDLARLYEKGEGKISFEFLDNRTHGLMRSYNCNDFFDSVSPDSDFEKKQLWHVEVYRLNPWTYECVINRL